MYVQWVSRNRGHKGGGVLIAQLVESKRVNGKSRKYYLAHLGTCREPVETLRHRFWFYEHCDQMLDRLALAPEDRAKVDAQLAARIRPPNDAERILWQRERATLTANFGRADGFALVGKWTAANEDERRRFLDELRKAEEAPALPASGPGKRTARSTRAAARHSATEPDDIAGRGRDDLIRR
jgi:hypothetical protein